MNYYYYYYDWLFSFKLKLLLLLYYYRRRISSPRSCFVFIYVCACARAHTRTHTRTHTHVFSRIRAGFVTDPALQSLHFSKLNWTEETNDIWRNKLSESSFNLIIIILFMPIAAWFHLFFFLSSMCFPSWVLVWYIWYIWYVYTLEKSPPPQHVHMTHHRREHRPSVSRSPTCGSRVDERLRCLN